MSPLSLDHVLRLTVRFHVGGYHREADVALPAGSALADLLPEIATLCGAPRISRPWHAMTAAGTALDLAVPLHQTSLDHGSVVVLSPRHESVAPVLRDAAESLADIASFPVSGLACVSAIAGCLGLIAVSSVFVPLSYAMAAGAVAALITVLWQRRASALSAAAIVLAGAAAATAVLETVIPSETITSESYGWAGLTASATMLVMVAAVAVIGGLGPRTGAVFLMLAGGVSLASLATFLPAHIVEPRVAASAVILAAGVLALGWIPGWATRSAGLQVPKLPTAGQDLGVADAVQPDVDSRAQRAVFVHEGLAAGAAIAMIPAVLVIGAQGGGFAQGLCLATAGAVLLHALRHRQAVSTWAWLLVCLAACLGVALAAVFGEGHPLQMIVALGIVTAGISAPMWASRIGEIDPTTTIWWERTESLAVAATLPLAAHVAGLFILIRGLG